MVETAGDAAYGGDMKRIILAVVLLLAACATPAERITDRLQAAGLPGAEARCMGNRLAAKLSLSQLQELNRVVKTEAGEHLTVNKIARRLGDADPALVARLVETGIVCAL